ncbi:MAG: hypothetical protein HY664_01395 [Chloroflexi bacterium]|nr:hypothetical protein [Chloroflexota bacterium]
MTAKSLPPGGITAKETSSSSEIKELAGFFTPFSVGVPQPWVADYKGIRYPGEVIVAEAWQEEWGQKLIQPDRHFRIVVLTDQQEIPPDSIKDSRIALCVPGKPSVQTERMAQEYRAIKERRGAYEVRDSKEETAAVQEQEMTARLGEEQRLTYAQGQVWSKAPMGLEGSQVFASTVDEGFNLLAQALLAHCYAQRPITLHPLPQVLTHREVGLVYEGLFGPKGDPAAEKAVGDFAVALGLAHPSNPHRLSSKDCPLFPILAARLAEGQGHLSTGDLYLELSERYGLTWPLITLYLLTYVHYAEPAVELHLKPNHEVMLWDRERFNEDTLTALTCLRVWWTKGLEENFDSLVLSKDPWWWRVYPYAQLIKKDLEQGNSPEEMSKGEEHLVAALHQLDGAITALKGELKSSGLGVVPEVMKEALRRLAGLSKAASGEDFYVAARREYNTPEALAADMGLYEGLAQWRAIASEVVAVKAYLEEATVAEGEMAMDRASLLGQLTLTNLLSQPHLWPSVKALFDWFKTRYRTAYQSHHRRYHQELAKLHEDLEEAKPQLMALARLNSIVELGPPLGEELQGQYLPLLTITASCPAGNKEESLAGEQPLCPHCRLSMGAETPAKGVGYFLKQLAKALRKQQHRLSSETIRQILAQRGERRIDRFLKVVQASDLSPLVNTLDDELVTFLRQLLVAPKPDNDEG